MSWWRSICNALPIMGCWQCCTALYDIDGLWLRTHPCVHANPQACCSLCQLWGAPESDFRSYCMQLGAAVISLKRLTMFLMLQDRSTEVRKLLQGCHAHA